MYRKFDGRRTWQEGEIYHAAARDAGPRFARALDLAPNL